MLLRISTTYVVLDLCNTNINAALFLTVLLSSNHYIWPAFSTMHHKPVSRYKQTYNSLIASTQFTSKKLPR